MKKTTLALTLSTLITLSSSAQALELLVVNNYDDASSLEIWKKAKTDEVPAVLLTPVSVASPSAAYAALFPKTFMQEELFAVCNRNCSENEIFREKNGEIDSGDLSKWDVVEQANVYFWLNKYFHFLDEKLSFRPDRFLKVLTNRELRDETQGKKLQNNAFFNPRDITLSFLPASKNLLFKLLGGKINRSGFDPSVVGHEASHYLFHHLFPNPINDEIGGLNEGFADYIANIFLGNPKVGLVMLHGQALRDSSAIVDKSGKPKTYAPGMEVHELGERVAYALWKTRELVAQKEEFDRLVIETVQDLGRNPYSTVHDFKVKMLTRAASLIQETDLKNLTTIWEITFSGSPIEIHNLDFLNKEVRKNPIFGFRKKQMMNENLAREYGTKAVEESNFSILQVEKISQTQGAFLLSTENGSTTTPYWVALDYQRGNVLGIYDLKKNLILEKKELEKVEFLADQAKQAASTLDDFMKKAKSFSELSQSKGEFSIVYKLKEKTTTSFEAKFNNALMMGNKIRLELKRKLIAGVLLGLPEIESIELYTLPLPTVTSLPQIDGQSVIGYKLMLKTGTAMEVVLDKYTLK